MPWYEVAPYFRAALAILVVSAPLAVLFALLNYLRPPSGNRAPDDQRGQ